MSKFKLGDRVWYRSYSGRSYGIVRDVKRDHMTWASETMYYVEVLGSSEPFYKVLESNLNLDTQHQREIKLKQIGI